MKNGYKPPCTTDKLYRQLPESPAESMTTAELAEKHTWYPRSVSESLKRLEAQCKDPNHPRKGTIQWESPRPGEEAQRVWLDLSDDSEDAPAPMSSTG